VLGPAIARPGSTPPAARPGRGRGTPGRRSRPAARPALWAPAGRAGWCRRSRSRRPGSARPARRRCSAARAACRPRSRWTATSNPSVSKIWEPMCECSPRSSSSGRPAPAGPLRPPARRQGQPRTSGLRARWPCTRGCAPPPHGDPQQHARPGTDPARGVRHPVHLGQRVDRDPADPGPQRPLDLVVQLVVAVQSDPLRRTPPRRRRRARARAHVQPEAVLDHPPATAVHRKALAA